MSNTLPPWTTRDSFRKDPHQRHIDRTNELSNLTPPASGEVLRTPFGTGVTTKPPFQQQTDYTVFISAVGTGTDLGTHKGGIYDGYCFRSLPSGGPTAGTFCRIINDDEIQSGAPDTDSHWVTGAYGTGRFDGELTSETAPRLIIHASGFGPTLDDGAPVVPFAATQGWQRHSPYVDPTNPANVLVGDVAPTLIVRMASGGTRTLRFDASGRLWSISHE